MNILIIHEIDWLKKVVFEIHTIAELLSLAGHTVYAIDYESMWDRQGIFDFGNLKTTVIGNAARVYTGASVELRRPGFIKIPGLSRLSAAGTQYAEIRKTIQEKGIDIILLYSVPTNGWQTIRLARQFGVPVVFRSIDILNQLVPHAALSPITRCLERKIYSQADLILTISPRLSRYVTNMGADGNKVKLLLLGTDTRTFRPGRVNDTLRDKWGLGKDVIIFIGTLFDFSGLDDFIHQFPEIRQKVPQAQLLIVGDGPQRPKLERLISEMALAQQVIITGFQPYETMPDYINLASICLNPFRATGATRDIFPTKILQYMACGKPVLATPLPGLQEIAKGEQEGMVYAGSPEEMANLAIELLQSESRRRQLGQNALEYVSQNHSYDKIVQQLESEFSELIVGKQK